MIQMIVSDLDGTIAGASEKLPDELTKLIQAIEDAGYIFTLATGRSDGYMKERIAQMKLRRPYIANNGATIMQESQCLMRKQFAISGLREISEKAHQLGLSIIYTFDGSERVTEITPWIVHEGEKHHCTYHAEPFTEKEWNSLKSDKVLIYDKSRSGVIREFEPLCAKISDASYVRYGEKAIELMHITANKASGLRKLCTLTGIPMQNVLAIGDDTNDAEFLREAGIGVAVANAQEAAKSCADFVCTKPEFEGVKEAISKFCGVIF